MFQLPTPFSINLTTTTFTIVNIHLTNYKSEIHYNQNDNNITRVTNDDAVTNSEKANYALDKRELGGDAHMEMWCAVIKKK